MLEYTEKYHRKRKTTWFDFVLGVMFVAYFTIVELICTDKLNCNNTIKYIADAVEVIIGILVALYFFTVTSVTLKKKKNNNYKNNKFEDLMEKVGPVSIIVGIIWLSILLMICIIHF